MDLTPFFIEFNYKHTPAIAEVRPCCRKDDVFYYDIYMNNIFEFSVSPAADVNNVLTWKIALKNADKQVDPELVRLSGEQIEKYYLNAEIPL